MVLKRYHGLRLNIGSRYATAEHKTHKLYSQISKAGYNLCHKLMLKAEAAQANCDAGSGLGGRSGPPQTKIFSHQYGGHLQPVGAKPRQPPPPTNRTLPIANIGEL